MAIRPEMVFKPSAESWLRHQSAYHLWQTGQNVNFHVAPSSARMVMQMLIAAVADKVGHNADFGLEIAYDDMTAAPSPALHQ
jgi:hypothetical protein